MVGSSSPLFFTGFLQAKVIKRVIRMLKTDVNNRNETAVTDERLGHERAQLVEMTPLPRSGSPPPRLSLFLFRPLLLPSRGLRRPTGDRRVKIAVGRRSVAAVRGSRAGGVPVLESHGLHRRSAARWAPLGRLNLPRGPCRAAGTCGSPQCPGSRPAPLQRPAPQPRRRLLPALWPRPAGRRGRGG